MRTSLLLFSTCLILACSNNVRPLDKPPIHIELSTGAWASRVDIGEGLISIVAQEGKSALGRVPQAYLDELVESATLTTADGTSQVITLVRQDFSQPELPSGGYQAAEIVFDSMAASSSGWNMLSFQLNRKTAWGGFEDRSALFAPFRVDSAPAITRISFYEDTRSVLVSFSEAVETLSSGNPFTVDGPSGEVACDLTFTSGTADATLDCAQSLPSTVTITLKDGYLASAGGDVRAVDGSPFVATINTETLPQQWDRTPTWEAALPHPSPY